MGPTSNPVENAASFQNEIVSIIDKGSPNVFHKCFLRVAMMERGIEVHSKTPNKTRTLRTSRERGKTKLVGKAY